MYIYTHIYIDIFSDMRETHMGSFDGCCLSSLLHNLYTESWLSAHEDRLLINFGDDNASLSLLCGSL